MFGISFPETVNGVGGHDSLTCSVGFEQKLMSGDCRVHRIDRCGAVAAPHLYDGGLIDEDSLPMMPLNLSDYVDFLASYLGM